MKRKLIKEITLSEIDQVTKHFDVIAVLNYLKDKNLHSDYVRGYLHFKGDKKLDFISEIVKSIHKDDVEIERSKDEVKVKIYSSL
jgi:hypothetical protein